MADGQSGPSGLVREISLREPGAAQTPDHCSTGQIVLVKILRKGKTLPATLVSFITLFHGFVSLGNLLKAFLSKTNSF